MRPVSAIIFLHNCASRQAESPGRGVATPRGDVGIEEVDIKADMQVAGCFFRDARTVLQPLPFLGVPSCLSPDEFRLLVPTRLESAESTGDFMATSFSKLKIQIAKLQKQAAAFQSTVVSRIKKEIAKHGLSIDDLFDSESTSTGASRRSSRPAKVATKSRKAGAAKPAKFSDGQGNTWHGIGKRPQWIHAALDAGHSLDDFLIGAKAAAATPAAKTAPKAAKNRAAGKKAAAKRTAVEGAAPPKKAAKTAVAKKSPKAVVATPSAKTTKSAEAAAKSTANKAPAKKAPAKKAASKKPARTPSQTASVPAAAAPAPQP